MSVPLGLVRNLCNIRSILTMHIGYNAATGAASKRMVEGIA